MVSKQLLTTVTLLASSLTAATDDYCVTCDMDTHPSLVCVKDAEQGGWKMKAIRRKAIEDMIAAGEAAFPGTGSLNEFCKEETMMDQKSASIYRRSLEAACVLAADGTSFVLADDEGGAFLAPKKNADTTTIDTPPEEDTALETMNDKCNNFGYEFGMKFDNGCVDVDMAFNEIRPITGTKSCQAPGTVKIVCSGDGADATITADVGFDVIIKGGTDIGYLYPNQPAGTPVTLNNGGNRRQAISHIEFCFTCTPPEEGTPTKAPTSAPSAAPSAAPTQSPTAAPSAAPTASPTQKTYAIGSTVTLDDGSTCVLQDDCSCDDTPSGAKGDPHFIMFNGRHIEFQGGCDLVLVDVPQYNNGQGLRIHIRTKIVTWFSYIERVALQIGDDVLEMKGGVSDNSRGVWVNGVMQNMKELTKKDGPLPFKIGGNDAEYQNQAQDIAWMINVLLPEGQVISLRTVKDYMRVDIDEPKTEYFGSAVGMMGALEGKDEMLARDGKSVLTHEIEFGQEWQVRDTEPMLFQAKQSPQYPEKCQMPSSWWKDPSSVKRRLAESTITQEDAELACVHLRAAEREDCVFDVVATGDLDIATFY